MSSPCVIDTEKRANHLRNFLEQAQRQRVDRAHDDALSKMKEVCQGTDAGFDTTSTAQQMGRPLSRQEIIARLTSMNSSLVFVQTKAYPEIGCIYVRDGESNMTDADTFYHGLRRVCGMEWVGISPEFTIRKVTTDAKGDQLMVGQVRGWRTILQRLIKDRLITIEAAEKAFTISRGRKSEKWYTALQ